MAAEARDPAGGIAVTGGIACGKSRFCEMLRRLGAEVLDADRVVRGLESPGGAAAGAILSRFGTLDRGELAHLVFGPGAEAASRRRDLESILLPLVRERCRAFAAGSPVPPATVRIVEIPLLFEKGWEADYATVIALVADDEIRIRRLAETRGMPRHEALARMGAQLPSAAKAARADFVVRNDSSPERLFAAARELLGRLPLRG